MLPGGCVDVVHSLNMLWVTIVARSLEPDGEGKVGWAYVDGIQTWRRTDLVEIVL